MKRIDLTINLTDDLGIKSIAINENDTGLKSDSNLLNNLAFAILKVLHVNNESIIVQDLLNDLDIKVQGF